MILFSNEKEKSEAVTAGPMARCTDITVCASPLVAPIIPSGAADLIYTKITPAVRNVISCGLRELN